MGLTDNIVHTLAKTALASLIITVVLVFYLEIPLGKMPMLLLVVLVSNLIASFIISAFMIKQRGY